MILNLICFFGGEGGGGAGSLKTNNRGELPKNGGLGQFADLRRGGLDKKEGVVFLRGLIPQCTLWWEQVEN